MEDSDWSYSGENGPINWHLSFPVALSDYQSPIFLNTDDVVYDPGLQPLQFIKYNVCSVETWTLINDGCGIRLDLKSDAKVTWLNSPSTYQVKCIYFHWGSRDNRGAEHIIDGRSYPMEIQIIHRNTKYDEADMYTKIDGLLAISIWAELSASDNASLENVVKNLHKVKYKGQETLMEQFSLLTLLPIDNINYYRYSGSLTMPPCNECVTWIIFDGPIKISSRQLEQFRQTMSSYQEDDEDIPLADNFRPTQRLCRRIVYASFKAQ